METVYRHTTLDDIDQQLELGKDIYVDMDQTVELNYLLKLVNFSDGQSMYNFSDEEALGNIKEFFLGKMYTLPSATTIVLICLYVPVFLMSLFGNGLVIFVVTRNAHMRRVKNLFLMNLALADLLVTVLCMPMVVGQIVVRLWVYGAFMCKVSAYMQGVTVLASIFTLTALSIDRYVALKAPLSVHRMNNKYHAVLCIILIWALAAFFLIPVIIVRSVTQVDFDRFGISVRLCTEAWSRGLYRQAYAIVLLVITYAIPILIITTCYSLIGRTLCSDEFHRKTSDSSSTVMLGRKRVARMLIALIAVFVFCWLPYNIFSLSLDISGQYHDTKVLPFTLCLAHAHSAINPVLYWFLNKSFRHCMRKALQCQPVRRQKGKDTPSPQKGDGGLERRHPQQPCYPPPGPSRWSPRQQRLQAGQAGYADLEMASPTYLRHGARRRLSSLQPTSTSSSLSSDSSLSEAELAPHPSVLRRQATPRKHLLRVTFGPTSTISTDLSHSSMTSRSILKVTRNPKTPPMPKQSPPSPPRTAPLAVPEDMLLTPPGSPVTSSIVHHSAASQPSSSSQGELFV